MKITKALKEKLKKIKIIAFDVDGVLTDAGMYYSSKGEEFKKFNARDGMSINLLMKAGFVVALITGENTNIVTQRAKKLKVTEVYLGARDKVSTANKLLKKYKMSLKNLLFVGDDWLDVEVMKKCGLAVAPADALPWAKKAANVVVARNGGAGVACEIVEIFQKAKII